MTEKTRRASAGFPPPVIAGHFDRARRFGSRGQLTLEFTDALTRNRSWLHRAQYDDGFAVRYSGAAFT
jgi:hypothetical protein